MKTGIKRVARTIALVLALCATGGAWAEDKANPVTGSMESYTYSYSGVTGGEWNTAGNWSPNATPYISNAGAYGSALVVGKTVTSTTELDGYELKVGAYDGAQISFTVGKIQAVSGNVWLTADESSKINVTKAASGQLGGSYPFLLSSACAGGITWKSELKVGANQNSDLPFHYYLKDVGTVVYESAISAGTHVIKQADVRLSGTSQVDSKTLVSFTSTTRDFSAAAIVKIKNSSGEVIGSMPLTSVNGSGSTTLTTSDAVGTCELVKSATDIKIYWVDGDPSAAMLYTPSINVNFSRDKTKISTYADVGTAGWAVPGVFWNTMTATTDSTFDSPLSSVSKLTDTGLFEEVTGLSVAVADTRGAWKRANLDDASDVRRGYIDDSNNGSQAPIVTVSGIPSDFANYRVVLYFSNNDDGVSFGYVEINDNAYWGTAKWGSSSSTAFTEGGNYLVSPVIARGDGSLKIKTRCMSGARSGLAAVQIVKADADYIASDDGTGALVWNVTPPTSGSEDGIISLTGDATLTVDSAASFGKLSVTGVGTLTLAGSAKISATAIELDKDVVLNANTARLDANTYKGSGNVVYTGSTPASGKGWTDSTNWKGTVTVKNFTWTAATFSDYGNTESTLELSGVTGYFNERNNASPTPDTIAPTLKLTDGTGDYAFGFKSNNGWSSNHTKIRKLIGTGKLMGANNPNGNNVSQHYLIQDGSGFTGSIDTGHRSIAFGTTTTKTENKIVVDAGQSISIGSGKKWTSSIGDLVVEVNGTLTNAGSITPNGGITVGSTGHIVNNWEIGSNDGSMTIVQGGLVETSVDIGIWLGGDITLNGELRAASLGKFGGGTDIRTGDSGVFTFIGSNNTQDQSVDYARITGTGTLRYADVSGKWRSLSTVNFPTGMITENNLSAGLICTSHNGADTVGSLSGSGSMRSDWGGSKNVGSRDLNIVQSTNTTYSGVFHGDDRINDVNVTPGASSSGTLTLSGTQTVSNNLNIAANVGVKVTGKWIGATTVAGSLAFGGANGTKIDGAVTTSSGSTLDFTDFTVGDVAPISGALTLDADTTIRFPAGVEFPYTMAGSIEGISTLEAEKYTIGGTPGTVPLLFSDGKAYTTATGTFAGGEEPIAWSGINWGGVTPIYGSEVEVTVSASGTLILGTLMDKVGAVKATFNVPAGKELTLTGMIETGEIWFKGEGTVVCKEATTLTGVIKGDAGITIIYPKHTLPVSPDFATLTPGAVWTYADWKGTLVLEDCGRGQNTYYPEGDTHGVVRFDQYGSAYSTIRAPGYIGISAVTDQNTTCPATLKIESGEVVEFNHGTGDSALNTNGAGFRFAKLAGTGTLRLDGTSDTAQYIFDNVSEFTGNIDITFPPTGGRKSFLFGAEPGWQVMNSSYAANLVILGDMTVGTGKYEDWTWDIPAGIIIAEGKTVTLQNGTKIRALGKDSEGTIKVQAGTSEAPVVAILEGVTNSVLNGRLEIGKYATLQINDTSLTKLTIPADTNETTRTYSNAGILDLSGCSTLAALHLALGESKDFDFTKVSLPSTCKEVFYDIGNKRDLTGYTLPGSMPGSVTNISYYATETAEEYANGGFEVTNVTAGTVWLIRQNGALIKTAVEGTGRTYKGGRSFAGAACWHEWDFEKSDDRMGDYGRFSTNETEHTSLITLQAVTQPTESHYSTCHISVQNEDKTLLSSAVHPYATVSFPTTTTGWSTAFRCSMPSAANTIGIAFGDTTSGILGLATGPETGIEGYGYVELFNWTNDVYTALAQLKVESPSDKDNMHIYVLSITNNTVTLYRDGEFIHTAQFALQDPITKFMVGNVSDRGEAANLPAAVTADNTGYVDYVRLYDKILPEADITGLSLRRPFVSGIDAYERTETLLGHLWDEENEWTLKLANNAGTTTANVPAASKNVTFIADGGAGVRLNLDEDVTYGTLIFAGSGDTGLYQTSDGWISAQMMVVRNGVNLTVDYDAVNLENAVVGVDDGASLAFNFADFPFADITTVTTNTLAGSVPAVLYDDTCTSRYSVVLPDALPANIESIEDIWDGISYKLVITPDHTAGGTVYYKVGALAAGMTVYTDSSFTSPTMLFPGDTLVISEASDTGDVEIDDSFNGVLSVQRATVNLTSFGSAALAGTTVTVAENCTLNFAGGSFGAMTLDGAGSFAFTANTTVASLTGSVGVNVPSGVTLTLGAVTPFVTGGVTGYGTVKLPAHSGSDGFNFNRYGGGGTIALTGFSDWILTANATINSALRLDEAMTITAMSSVAYTFAKITGTGDLTFPSAGDTPTSITISNLADYSGTIVNNSSTAVTVTKLTKSGVYLTGDVLLKKDGAGDVTVSAVEIGTAAAFGLWDGNNYILAAAKYNGQGYPSVAEAMSAAGVENLGDIIVYDTSVTPGAQYKFVTDDEGVTRIAQMSIAVKKNGAYLASGYTDSIWDAIVAIYQPPSPGEYDYIEILSGSTFVIPYDRLGEGTVKIRNNGATPIPQGLSDDCQNSVSNVIIDAQYQYTEYSKGNKPTLYTWTGGAYDPITETFDTRWDAKANWSYVNNSSQTVTASRQPQSGDMVIFNANATVTVGNDVTVASITNSASVVFTNTSGTSKVTTGGFVLTQAGASISVTGVTLLPEPTVSDSRTLRLKKTTSDQTTTYTAVDKIGTIFSVY